MKDIQEQLTRLCSHTEDLMNVPPTCTIASSQQQLCGRVCDEVDVVAMLVQVEGYL